MNTLSPKGGSSSTARVSEPATLISRPSTSSSTSPVATIAGVVVWVPDSMVTSVAAASMTRSWASSPSVPVTSTRESSASSISSVIMT
jgi:hypothetical protein